MSRPVLVLLTLALGLGLYLWLVEMPADRKRLQSEAESAQLVNFKDTDVRGITVRSATGDIELTRNTDPPDGWTITKPRAMEADRQAVEDFLRTLVLAKVSRVVDDSGKDLAAYGLVTPALSVSLRLASGNQSVQFGDSGPLSSTLYAQRNGEPKVLLTSVSGRDILTKGLQDFRRKRVLEFDRVRVTRLKVENPEETVVLYKEGRGEKGTWTIKAPVETTADQPEVKSLLFGLEDLKAQAFIDDPERRIKKEKLKAPIATITVHEEGQPKASDSDHIIRLFVSSENSTTAYAETSAKEPIYLVPAAAAKDLAKTLFALRNKQLIAAEPEQVKTLVIKKDGDEYSLTHEGNDWLIDGNPGAKADAGRINMFVTRAIRLQAERVVTDKPGDSKSYGLSPPVAELTAADGQGKVLGSLAVGRQENHLAFARGSAMPGVFQIRPDILQEIPKKTDLIKLAP
jgi:hypothetical protein